MVSTEGWPRGRRARLWLAAALCVVGASVVLAAACGGDGEVVQGPSAEELTAWAQSLDTAGAALEAQSVSYAVATQAIKKTAEKNAAALKKWDKEWKKRQAAYDKDVAEVEAHNAAERQKAAANPSHLEPGKTGTMTIIDPYTGEHYTSKAIGMAVSVPGYRPQYHSLPAKPRMPAKVKVRLADEIKRLKKLEAHLSDLDAQFATLVVGSQFAAVLSDLQRAVADVRTPVVKARKALKKAVKTDKNRGDVIVAKRVAGLKAASIVVSIDALHEALLEAAQAVGVVEALTWASSGVVTPPSPAVSVSPTP